MKNVRFTSLIEAMAPPKLLCAAASRLRRRRCESCGGHSDASGLVDVKASGAGFLRANRFLEYTCETLRHLDRVALLYTVS
jgi:hypothetical protein